MVFAPGALENAIKYNALNSELASHSHTSLALDCPGETRYVQLSDGKDGVYGLDPAEYTTSWLKPLYDMRIAKAKAVIEDLFPQLAN